jgi:hypothetical protein
MSGSSPADASGTGRKPPWWVWLAGGGAVLLLAFIIAIVATQLPSGGTEGQSPTGAGDASSTPSPGPTDVDDPSPAPSTTPTPVPIGEPAAITPGVLAAIDQIEAVQGEAKGPGEVAGPAIRFRVSIRNSTDSDIDLRATVVTVDYGTGRTPALQLFAPGASPLATSVASGATATAVYVFTIPADARDLVHITVDYTVGVPPLEFTGAVPVG